MLLGEYEHTLDEKNRVTLPAKFRKEFAGGVVLTRGMDGCIAVYTAHDWERFVETRLDALDPLSKLKREVVVAGMRDHVEIWDRAAWREQLEEVEGSAELVAERLAQKRD
jgi:MraZ protein